MRRRAGASVALVPTMGSLHAGHAALIDQARKTADFVIVSVFVNPTQFAPGEDYERYPRTLEPDRALAGEHGADAVFAPVPAEVYPHGTAGATAVAVPGLSEILCGASRPGHFRGVTSVVARLFNIAEPDVALFGEKDYQQLVVIRRMAEELFFPTRVVGVPTVRETDGLALSSRNQYLTAVERTRAPALRRALESAAAERARGADPAAVGRAGMDALATAGFRPEYFEVRRAADLGPPEAGASEVILAAGWLGKARLIDNIRLD